MKVAAIQMVSSAVLDENLHQARTLLQAARAQGAELAVLPEYFCLIGQHDRDKLALKEAFGTGPIQDFLRACARELGLWLVGGTLPLAADETIGYSTVCWPTTRKVIAWPATTKSTSFASTTGAKPTTNRACCRSGRSLRILHCPRATDMSGAWP